MLSQDISEVTYSYNTCGMTGQRGPDVLLGQCSSHYDNTNSTITRDGVLFRVSGYRGTQGFRVRRSGWYNLTVAGAAGGRGLCSLYYGRGAILKVTAYLTAGQNATILVGQKGTGPCDVDPSHELCLKPPVNVNESGNCSSLWWNANMTDSGGGGGGGASLVVLLNVDTLVGLPLVMSGGGGGSGALYLNGSIPVEMLRNISDASMLPGSGNNGEVFTCIDYGDCTGGTKLSIRPGVGSGWKGDRSILAVDGHSFNIDDDFAEGGLPCSSDSETYGGFGGGGGGCGGGGGGGGYTGGSAIENTPLAPGGRGTLFVANSSSGEEVILLDSYTNDDVHGFVEIVPVDCGCIGSCVVYESEQFECVCPENSVLAPDQSDCYNGMSLKAVCYCR